MATKHEGGRQTGIHCARRPSTRVRIVFGAGIAAESLILVGKKLFLGFYTWLSHKYKRTKGRKCHSEEKPGKPVPLRGWLAPNICEPVMGCKRPTRRT